jgi:hypothetical protein
MTLPATQQKASKELVGDLSQQSHASNAPFKVAHIASIWRNSGQHQNRAEIMY